MSIPKLVCLVSAIVFVCSIETANANEVACDVQQAQNILKGLGFAPGPIDGIWGKATRTAVLNFQSEKSLERSGALDQTTCEALNVQLGGIAELESLLVQEPGQAATLVPRIEAAIVSDIRENGVGQRFIIEGIRPVGDNTAVRQSNQDLDSRVRIFVAFPAEMGTAGMFAPEPEISPESASVTIRSWEIDEIQNKNQEMIRLWRFKAVLMVTEYSGDQFSTQGPLPQIPMGSGSIHRFRGGGFQDIHEFLHMPVQQTKVSIFNRGGEHNRITFVALDGIGYVYVRGKGIVIIDPEGDRTIIELGN